MRVCTARVNLTNRHQAQRRGELQVPRYRGHAGAAARNGRGFSAKLRRLGGVLFVFLSALLTGFPAQADSMLFGNSPALPRSQAVLSLGEDAINWSSTDEQLGVVDTGRIVPQVWRQFRSQSVFQYRETSLRLYGRVRSFGGKLTAVVDVVYDGRRARYLLEQLVQTSEENANSSYPPATADPEGGRKSVEGIVTHALTEVPIEGATVSVGGRSATTDNEGMYRILNVAPGTYEVAASRDDFVTSRLQAKIGSCGSSYDSSYDCGAEVVSLTLTPRPANPQEPAITAVRRQYEGIFLKNISVNNRYEVSVAWQGTPGSVKFKIDGDEYVVAGGPNGASRSFDMGQDFPGSLAPRGTALTITAVNGEGVESAPRVLYPIVIPIPAWSVELGLWDLVAGGGPGGLDYELGTEFPDPALEGTTQVPRFVPIFGGDKIGIDETQIFGGLGFSGTSAQGTITAGGKTGFSAGTASIAGSLKGTGTLKYQPNVGLVWVKAQADLEISGTIKPPPVPVSDLIVPGSGFIARVIRPILRAEITSEFGPTITADVVLVQQNNEVAFESSEFSGAVAVKIALVLSAGPAELSFYGGGSSKIVILFAEPPPPSLLKQIMLRLYAGIQARLWIFSGKVEAASRGRTRRAAVRRLRCSPKSILTGTWNSDPYSLTFLTMARIRCSCPPCRRGLRPCRLTPASRPTMRRY
ncbi:MAG: carboxypeptidase-like regulatory domain-containing protein [Gammaproteobacteria bacterium]|nr:carboxypeptidase-like regulatory domain-containing protein [Gammaproteobacteria bacterium]